MTCKEQIMTDDCFLIGALLKLQQEKLFSAESYTILNSMCLQYKRKFYLTDKQLETCRNHLKHHLRWIIPMNGIPSLVNNKPEINPVLKITAVMENNKYILNFPFDNYLILKIKKLPGAYFDKTKKKWSCSCIKNNAEQLRSWGFQIKEPEEQIKVTPVEVPGLKKELLPFQKEGVGFIELKKGRALIADEMGLGKTVQALAWIHLHPENRPVVIIVPASVKLNWYKEIKEWLPEQDVSVLFGKTPDPTLLSKNINIINYDIVSAWSKYLNPFTLILDESHYIKSKKAKRTKSVMNLAKDTPFVLALTGTPIVNRPMEFFNTINLIAPNMFSYWQFANRYCDAKHTRFGWNTDGARNKKELHRILTETIMIRRKKKEVLPELPDKRRVVVSMEGDNMIEYKRAESDFITWLKVKDRKAADRATNAESLVKIEYLKQLSLEGKINNCVAWIKDFLESGEKLVVFCTHKKTMQRLREEFPKNHVHIDGSVNTQERQNVVDKFQTDPRIKLFFGNIKAAGIGITLTTASNTCFVELGWTPGEHDQAEDRVHRIGQESDSVTAWYLINEKTIDNLIMTMLDKKRKVVDQVLDGKTTKENYLLTELLNNLKKTIE